jgi:hypothetical protein
MKRRCCRAQSGPLGPQNERAFANALALDMGHATDLIFANYREIVSPDEAERFWSILPAGTASDLFFPFYYSYDWIHKVSQKFK